MHYVSMMWRFSFLFLFAATVLQAQTPPPPPPPPPLQLYTPPTKEEMTAWYFKQHEVMDELLNSSEYYKPEDLIFYESSQTSKAELKLKSSRVEAIDEDSNVVGQFNFEVLYNAQGQIAQTTQFGEGSRYEYIRRWKYNTAGKVQSYVTLDRETDAATKKVKVNGDSMVINYLPSGSISDIKRYSVRNSGASRTASLISTRKFIYNADGTLKQRSEDGSNYFYFYDAEKHPVRVCTVADRKASGDSLSWKSDGVDMTVEHWVVETKTQFTGLMEKQVINIATGNMLLYSLFGDGKFNYIRGITGPLTVKCTYDVQNRCIVESYYSMDNMLLSESAYEYFNGNTISKYRVSVFWALDENNSLENYPPHAQLAADNLYEVYEVNYDAPKENQMPAVGRLTRHLVSIKNGKREVLATKPGMITLKIVCTYN
ncbi:MAG: hypothetical protein L6Q81_12215 [Bacteroidia bacterium]|nr:hypothetical protein [Bacteroidia bacterium]